MKSVASLARAVGDNDADGFLTLDEAVNRPTGTLTAESLPLDTAPADGKLDPKKELDVGFIFDDARLPDLEIVKVKDFIDRGCEEDGVSRYSSSIGPAGKVASRRLYSI